MVPSVALRTKWLSHIPLQASKVTLRDVGKVIKSLVGDFYHPLYLSKEFQQKLAPEKPDLAGEYLVKYNTCFKFV